jgi:hypothetical protein
MVDPGIIRTMSIRTPLRLGALLLLAAAPASFAAPTREMTTDRPDVTESPYTIDPGYRQIELSFAEYSRDTQDGVRGREWAVAPLNLRIGLTPSAEVQLMFDPWRRSETRNLATGATGSISGRGDFTVRSKINLWGDDGEGTAFAIMPFVGFPTGARGIRAQGVEGGLVLPFAASLPAGWDVSAMSEIDWVRNDRDDGYAVQALHSASFGHALTKDVGAYLELTATTGQGPAQWTFDAGATYAVTSELQLDAGVNLGLNRAAGDVTIFAGIARRF